MKFRADKCRIFQEEKEKSKINYPTELAISCLYLEKKNSYYAGQFVKVVSYYGPRHTSNSTHNTELQY